MASAGFDMVIKWDLRPCLVDDQKALFHRWANKSQVVAPSNLMGGHFGGKLEQVMAVVEYEDGSVGEVYPYRVKFLDTPWAMAEFERYWENLGKVFTPDGNEVR